MQSLGALITRVREYRADTLAADAATLFARASDLYEATTPQLTRRRAAAHRLAARAERLAARSYRWRPAPLSDPGRTVVSGGTRHHP